MNNLLFSLAEVGSGIASGLNSVFGTVGYAILVNFIGVLAIVVKITETQNKKRNRIIFFASLGALCWVLYFILYGDFTSAVVNLIGFVQLLVFYQRGKHKWADSKFWLYFFLAVQVGLAFVIWKSPFSLFAIFGGLLGTVAYFVMNEKVYRYLFAIVISLWIGNGIVYFYPIALIHDIFALISIIIAIVRFNILGKEKKEQKSEQQAEGQISA